MADYSTIEAILERAITRNAFPAAVVEVGSATGSPWRHAFGRLTYVDAPETTTDTIFDLASLTKVLATAPLTMRAVNEGLVRLDDRLSDRLPGWRGADREDVTIRDLLEHSSGLTAYLPFFRDHRGRADFESAICGLPLEYAPRTRSIYSDLGFILLAFVLEDAFGRPLADLFGSEPDIRFDPPREWRERTAPTELDLWRGRLLQGEVHDENTWALGGAAGHAGLFGTAAAVGRHARRWLTGVRDDPMFAEFVHKSIVPGSSRALGWDTMLPTSSCGTKMSADAFGHTGFTGTSLWIDPSNDLYVVLLTNRIHPTRENNQIQTVRRQVHDAVLKLVKDEEQRTKDEY